VSRNWPELLNVWKWFRHRLQTDFRNCNFPIGELQLLVVAAGTATRNEKSELLNVRLERVRGGS
jgi:hypothetical protein